MKRISTDAEYLDSGRVTIDADGIPVDLGYRGTGSPEGNVVAPVGSIYTDTAATNGAIRWIKTSGTGNTGWRVEYGNTGWRTLWDPSNTSTMDSGRITSSRDGNFVTLVFDQCVFNVEHPALNAIPAGFRGLPAVRAIQLYSGDWPSPNGTGRVSTAGWFNLYRVPVGTPIFGQVTYQTSEAWPSSLPGTPA